MRQIVFLLFLLFQACFEGAVDDVGKNTADDSRLPNDKLAEVTSDPRDAPFTCTDGTESEAIMEAKLGSSAGQTKYRHYLNKGIRDADAKLVWTFAAPFGIAETADASNFHPINLVDNPGNLFFYYHDSGHIAKIELRNADGTVESSLFVDASAACSEYLAINEDDFPSNATLSVTDVVVENKEFEVCTVWDENTPIQTISVHSGDSDGEFCFDIGCATGYGTKYQLDENGKVLSMQKPLESRQVFDTDRPSLNETFWTGPLGEFHWDEPEFEEDEPVVYKRRYTCQLVGLYENMRKYNSEVK